jgi:alpha-L-fucosidase
MDAQLKELLTGYGDVAGIWFDGWWDRPDAEWRLAQTYKLIHDLQPSALIGSNHHKKPFPGEDFQMFEKDLPGHNTAGFNEDSEIGKLPLETCDTMNNSWGYNLKDQQYKSTATLIRYLVRAAGYNANFLLNVGPMPNGRIQPEFVKTLREIGEWTSKYGESIYGTRGGPVAPRDWGVTTRKGNKIYVHVLNWNDPVLALPTLNERVVSAKLLKDGSKVDFGAVASGLLVNVPPAQEGEHDRVIVLEVAGK